MKVPKGPREMAQHLGALAALSEELGSVFSILIWWLTTICNSTARGSDTFWHTQTDICIHMVHIQ